MDYINISDPLFQQPAKFCVIMENYAWGNEDIMVVFISSNQKFSSRKTAVRVNDGAINGIKGDTVIECHNWRLIPTSKILNDPKAKYLGQLPISVINQLNDAVAYLRVDLDVLIRMID